MAGAIARKSYSAVTFGFQFKVYELADEKTMGLHSGGNPRNKLEYSILDFSLFWGSAGGQGGKREFFYFIFFRAAAFELSSICH